MSREEREGASSRRYRIVRAVGRGWQRLLGVEPLWVALYLVAGMAVLLPQGTLFESRVEPGEIASRSYVAGRDLLWEDEETTAQKRARAREEVRSVYDFEPAAAQSREDELVQLFEVGRASLSRQQAARDRTQPVPSTLPEEAEAGQSGQGLSALESLLAASQLKIDAEHFDLFRRQRFAPELEERLKIVISEILRRGVVSNKAELLEKRERGISLRNLETGEEELQLDLYRYLGYPEEVQEVIEAESRRWLDLSRHERALVEDFLMANISPNLHPNRSETLARQAAAAEGTAPVFQRQRAGQVIVRKGDEIDATAAELINAMLGGKSRLNLLIPAAGNLLLLLLGALTVRLALKRERSSLSREPVAAYSGLLMLLVLSLVGLWLSFLTASALGGFFESTPFNTPEIYYWAIPYASVALIAFLIYGRSIALVTGVVFSILSGQLVEGESWSIVVYSLAASVAAVYFLERIKKRSTLNQAGLLIGVVNMVSVVMITSLGTDGIVELDALGLGLLCAFAGGLLAAAVTGFVVPLFEWLLSVTTDITLVELSNTNLPLLRRLAFEAPGTFQHSLMVANLAKAGCAEIGAEAVLAYTAGLYHDIGKLNRPEYFIENQRGQNPHDALEPSLSALIVISHVKEGLEMAREARLPPVIHDAIAQHHGTHLLTYFYSRALECAAGGPIDEEAYRYPGPKPQSRVMAVLMLADAVEAASRSLVDPTAATLRNVVEQIFEAHVGAGQLDQCDLTLADLKLLAAEFLRVLETFHHRRVDYPGFDFRTESDSSRLRVVKG